ncbi:hypothetical protein AKJ39_02475 [candidate division MSBL1 archaeon SCGC-AAA259J03]|uniref:Uncharacterized protein n=1 Tax=candidate division MSBL1 archaeon SCGC-AAA259J03 TaxID=1698269 RepID=A0A656YW90_9EURY|nr:hypothetical protein AKJ39_02475 [candidate division MSBL1 archaeon SCGC-AAA259J03]
MRWLFVEPPVQGHVHDVLGAAGIPSSAYLASPLEEEGEKVRIEDAPTLNHDLRDVKEKIEDFDPDYVGISAMTPTAPAAYRVAEVAKKSDPDRNVIMGGPHPTLLPEETMVECPSVDILVRGEGERTIRELSRGKDPSNIKGVTYRENGEIVENEDRPPITDLDELPFPAYHLLPMDQYKVAGIRYATMITSRGCPFNCTFCASSRICGEKWRGKSPERVLEQIKLLRQDYGVREIEMLDDTFVLDRDRAVKICDLIIENNVDVSWSCSSRVDTIDKSLAERLKEAGCHTIYLGIESGVQETLDRLKKGITIKQVKNAVSSIKETGLNAVGSFILGVPGEAKKQMEKTVEFAKELGLTLAQFTIFTPYPGTEAYEEADKNDKIGSRDWSKYTTMEPVMEREEVDHDELKNFMRLAYLKFYFRPSYIWKAIKNGFLWSLLKKGVKNLI